MTAIISKAAGGNTMPGFINNNNDNNNGEKMKKRKSIFSQQDELEIKCKTRELARRLVTNANLMRLPGEV
jgi:hypothetical protein